MYHVVVGSHFGGAPAAGPAPETSLDRADLKGAPRPLPVVQLSAHRPVLLERRLTAPLSSRFSCLLTASLSHETRSYLHVKVDNSHVIIFKDRPVKAFEEKL